EHNMVGFAVENEDRLGRIARIDDILHELEICRSPRARLGTGAHLEADFGGDVNGEVKIAVLRGDVAGDGIDEGSAEAELVAGRGDEIDAQHEARAAAGRVGGVLINDGVWHGVADGDAAREAADGDRG